MDEIKIKKSDFIEKIVSFIEICESNYNIYGILICLKLLKTKNIRDFNLKSFNFNKYFKFNSSIKNLKISIQNLKKEIKFGNRKYFFANETIDKTQDELIWSIQQKSYFMLNSQTAIASNNRNFVFFYNPAYGIMKLFIDEKFDITVLNINQRAFSNKLGQISFFGDSKTGFLIFIPKDFLLTDKHDQNVLNPMSEILSSFLLRP